MAVCSQDMCIWQKKDAKIDVENMEEENHQKSLTEMVPEYMIQEYQ